MKIVPCMEDENTRGFPGLGEGRTILSKKMEHTAEILEQFLGMFLSV